MVSVCVYSLVAILAHWRASTVVLWSMGNARPIPFQWEDFACPMEPNSMSRLWGELYCVSCIRHVRGDE